LRSANVRSKIVAEQKSGKLYGVGSNIC